MKKLQSTFIPVSGHLEHIWAGSIFRIEQNCIINSYYRNTEEIEGSNFCEIRSIYKKTTMWEVLWYLLFTLARLPDELLNTTSTITLHTECKKLIDAVRDLLPYVALLFKLEIPEVLLQMQRKQQNASRHLEVIAKELLHENSRGKEEEEQHEEEQQERKEEMEKMSVIDVSCLYTNVTVTSLTNIYNTVNELCNLCNELWYSAQSLNEYCELFDTKRCIICFEDVTSVFTSPSVIDIKLGKLRYSPCTPPVKVTRILAKESKYCHINNYNYNNKSKNKKEKSKTFEDKANTIANKINNNSINVISNSSSISTLGLRICGARYVNQCNNTTYVKTMETECQTTNHVANDNVSKWLEYTKQDGYYVSSARQLQNKLQAFLCGKKCYEEEEEEQEEEQLLQARVTHENIKKELPCERVVSTMTRLHEAIQNLTNFFTSPERKGKELLSQMALVSTSLLIIYEGNYSENCNNIRVMLIDFARSSLRKLNFTEEKVGFVFGLQTLVSLLAISAQ